MAYTKAKCVNKKFQGVEEAIRKSMCKVYRGEAEVWFAGDPGFAGSLTTPLAARLLYKGAQIYSVNLEDALNAKVDKKS